MADTLNIFGTEYTNVAGIIATDDNGNELTYTRGGGSNDFVVTVSYNDTTEMWEPDKTYAEVKTAYDAGKTVAFECDEFSCLGQYESELDQIFYYIYENGPFIASVEVRIYLWNSNGIVEQEGSLLCDVKMANAVESDVAQGKVFVNSTGYHTGTAVAPTLSLQTKSISITPSETAQSQTVTPDSGYDGLDEVSVSVGAISSTYVGTGITRRSSTDLTASGAIVTVPSGYYSEQASKAVASGTAGTPTATKGTVSNHSVSVTPSVTNTTGYITGGTKTGTAITVSASELVSGTYTVSASGTHDVTNYASASVASGSATAPASISGTSASITTGTNTITLTKTVSVIPSVTAGYVSSGTAGNSSVSLTASVTVNPTPTASGKTVTIPAGYYSAQTTKDVSTGSATAPASISGTAASISTGTNTLTLTKTVSVTPTVSAGYVSAGTAGNSSVSLTASVTTKAAATITPTTTNQTIAAGTYLTGIQTIAGDADLVASNIISTANIFGVQGSVVVQSYYTGSSAPASSLGQNGDIYLQE